HVARAAHHERLARVAVRLHAPRAVLLLDAEALADLQLEKLLRHVGVDAQPRRGVAHQGDGLGLDDVVADGLVRLALDVAHAPREVQAARGQLHELPVDGADLLAELVDLAQRNPSMPTRSRSRSRRTGTARGTMHGSWRPFTRSSAGSPVRRSTVCCVRGMLLVGLNAARKRSGMPVVSPPSAPPLWLAFVRSAPFS